VYTTVKHSFDHMYLRHTTLECCKILGHLSGGLRLRWRIGSDSRQDQDSTIALVLKPGWDMISMGTVSDVITNQGIC